MSIVIGILIWLISEWQEPVKGGLYPVDIDKGVSFRTNKHRYTSYYVDIFFYTVGPIRSIFSLKIKFNDYEYTVRRCRLSFQQKLKNVPDDVDKTWFMTRNNGNLTLLCNNVTVFGFKLKGGACSIVNTTDIHYVKVGRNDNCTTQITVNNSKKYLYCL